MRKQKTCENKRTKINMCENHEIANLVEILTSINIKNIYKLI